MAKVTNNTASLNTLSLVNATGRYVRMHGLNRATMYGYSLWEFQVFGTIAPLPVTLTTFEAGRQGTGVTLRWQTAMELQNAGFQVPRSADGAHFINLAFVPGAGTNGQTKSYVYTDTAPLDQVGYYRLKQVNINSKDAYSPVRVVEAPSRPVVTLFPNPIADQITLKWEAPVAGPVRLTLTNALGQVVRAEAFDQQVGFNALPIAVQAFPAGVYVITLEVSGQLSYRTRIQK